MPIVLGNTTIEGLGVGGLPNGVVNADDIANNAITRAKMGYAGAVLQVMQVFKTDTNVMSVSSFTNIPGLEITITPSNASSLILVMTSVQATVTGLTAQLRITRNETAVGVGGAASSRTQTLMGAMYPTADGNHQSFPFASSFLDNPASTSALTYRIQLKCQGGGTGNINRSANDADNGDWSHRSTSNITVMEIAG